MKRKLTLTVDNDLTHRAKRLARKRGKSLSALIEDLLKRETEYATGKARAATFSERWGGQMTLSTRPGERLAKLQKKYGLTRGD